MTNKTDREIVENTMTAADVLRQYQKQIDMEGIEVGVSRQALDEVLEQFAAYEQRIADLEEVITEIMQEHEIPASDWIKGLLK